ncbi:chitinase [Agrobacterium sp. 10MFCol1.1]|uniref:chitinase n=1 Tax=Agrobacterium sp. 10MFCol1.1 TaxID=1150775 RepID=UPI000475CBC0|nr:chitinase [Agrobacterium sp. 10MFCol1.1]
MAYDEARFFASVRISIYGGRLRAAQLDGTKTILAGFGKALPGGDPRWLAYMLATTFHETAATMQPVRETLAVNDAEAIARLDRAFAAGRLPMVRKPYWRPDAEGKSWLGRGFVQLTHRRNYEAMSQLTGVDLLERPERAMEPDVATAILIHGMVAGSFTGRKLADVFEGKREDWEGARAIINGRDRARLVGDYGRAFHRALLAARIEPARAR